MNLFELFVKIGADDSGLQSGIKKAGAAVKGFAKAAGVATGAAVAGVAAITKASVSAYANYEQLTGGVETLFGAGGKGLMEFIESSGESVGMAVSNYRKLTESQNTVIANAKRAYKTAGMDMNTYMETVTSFSASLIQSLGGDTVKAAEYADMAITDMSDNANKMGTDIGSIQYAYQGFAKQNYTMLDNLKLGYGGTKTEMERLVGDAEKLDKSFKAQRDSSGNLTLAYADVVDAIHIVQENMGITGTTAKEAASTIEGSVNTMKASWENWKIALADPNADIGEYTDKLVQSAETVFDNVLPVVTRVLDNLVPVIAEKAPELVQKAVDVITDNLPLLIDSGIRIVVALTEGLIKALPELIKAIPELVKAIVKVLSDSWPQLKAAGADLLNALWDGVKSIARSIAAWVANWWSGLWKGKNVKPQEIGVSNGHSGSFASGLDYVPYNDFPATLHRGEAVLTASEAESWRRRQTRNNTPMATVPITINVNSLIDGMKLANNQYRYNLTVSRNHGVRMVNA